MKTKQTIHAIRIALSVCAIVATGSSIHAQAAASSMTLKKADQDFVVRAAVLNQEEIRLSQLALTRATNADVRAYAQKIISDHQASATKLTQLATSKGVNLAGLDQPATGEARRMGSSPSGTPSTAPGSRPSTSSSDATTTTPPARADDTAEAIREGVASIQEKETALAKKAGREFDEAYLEAMIKGHSKAIDLFRDAARNRETDSQLAAFASELIESLRAHHQRAEELAKAIDA